MANPIRGMAVNPEATALYVVSAGLLQRVNRDGTRVQLGTLNSRRGYVDMKIGTGQLVIVDGANLYVYNLTSGAFNRVVSSGWLGSRRVAYVDGYFIFSDPGTGTWYISAIEDASSLNALDFAQASSSPDDIQAVYADHGEVWLFGSKTTEVWNDTGASDFPFEKNKGATMQTGLMGAFTVRSLDNTLFWLGADENGAGMVWKSQGYQPVRVSTKSVDEAIQKAIRAGADMTQAIAYTYQQNGHSFYALQVPGLDTTWVFDVSVGHWHERAEFVLGRYKQSRIKHHVHCYGKNLVAGDDGEIYELKPGVHNNAGDILVRDRISPHYATPSMAPIKFGPFNLDCTVGRGKPGNGDPRVMLRTSDDGGSKWNSWRQASLGRVGETLTKSQFLRNGAARDRVWHVRCTDDVEFDILGAKVAAGA